MVLFNDCSKLIKQLVPIWKAVDMYLLDKKCIKRSENNYFIQCPFHPDKTPSLSIKGVIWKCFGCGESGDVISFISKLFNLNFISAIEKLNIDFNLNLLIPGKRQTIRQVYSTNEIIQELYKKQNEMHQIITKSEQLYDELLTDWAITDQIMRIYEPETIEKFWDVHPLYVEACNRIDIQKDMLDNFLLGGEQM